MRPGCPAGHADPADELALPDQIAFLHGMAGAVQKGAPQAHAVVNHQQSALKTERVFRSENHDTIGRCNEWRAAGAGRDVHPRMV